MTLVVPDVAGCTSLELALRFADAGLHTFPLNPASKQPVTWFGSSVFRFSKESTTDRATLTRWFAATSYAVGLDLYRSGLMAFDVDKPALLPAEFASAFAEHPTAYQSTRVDQPGRGHVVYALPWDNNAEDYLRLGSSPKPLHGAGEVKGFNGYLACGPVHEKAASGGRYAWLRREVCDLPAVLLSLLPVRDTTTAGGHQAPAEGLPDLSGEPDEEMRSAALWAGAIDQRAACVIQVRVLHEAAAGHPGGLVVLERVRAQYAATRASQGAADATWARMLRAGWARVQKERAEFSE